MLEQIIQVRVRLHIIRTGRHHQREEIGARLGADRIVAEEPGFSARRVMFDLPFDIVVVDRDVRVLQMPGQLWPLAIMPDAA